MPISQSRRNAQPAYAQSFGVASAQHPTSNVQSQNPVNPVFFWISIFVGEAKHLD
jgi:hypothetical protein